MANLRLRTRLHSTGWNDAPDDASISHTVAPKERKDHWHGQEGEEQTAENAQAVARCQSTEGGAPHREPPAQTSPRRSRKAADHGSRGRRGGRARRKAGAAAQGFAGRPLARRQGSVEPQACDAAVAGHTLRPGKTRAADLSDRQRGRAVRPLPRSMPQDRVVETPRRKSGCEEVAEQAGLQAERRHMIEQPLSQGPSHA